MNTVDQNMIKYKFFVINNKNVNRHVLPNAKLERMRPRRRDKNDGSVSIMTVAIPRQ